MDFKILTNLLRQKAIRVGNLTSNHGIYQFEELSLLEMTDEELSIYLKDHIKDLAFSTFSMGKTAFYLEGNKFIQIKGIDTHLDLNENEYMTSISSETILDGVYPICLFHTGDQASYHFRGAFLKEEFHEEMLTNILVREHIRTSSNIQKYALFDQRQCDEFHLPRPGESVSDYLKRIKFTGTITDPDFLNRQLIFTQIIRRQDNIFRVSDLQRATDQEDLPKAQAILAFTISELSKETGSNLKIEDFSTFFARRLGSQAGSLVDQCLINFNPLHNQDISLSAELCGSNFYQYTTDQDNDRYHFVTGDDYEKQIYLQIYTLANSLKVVTDTMQLLGYSPELEDQVLDIYITSILERITAINAYDHNLEFLANFLETLGDYPISEQIMMTNNHFRNSNVESVCQNNQQFYEKLKKKLKEQIALKLTKKPKTRKKDNRGNISTSFMLSVIFFVLIILTMSTIYLLF